MKIEHTTKTYYTLQHLGDHYAYDRAVEDILGPHYTYLFKTKDRAAEVGVAILERFIDIIGDGPTDTWRVTYSSILGETRSGAITITLTYRTEVRESKTFSEEIVVDGKTYTREAQGPLGPWEQIREQRITIRVVKQAINFID